MTKYDLLMEFIPYLETVSADEVVHWEGGEKSTEGYSTMPYPVYDGRLKAFIKTIYELDILDKEYLKTIESSGINTPVELEKALHGLDYKLTIAFLTYYVRQERFCDGLWARAVKEKIFLRIIKRLLELQLEK